VGTPEEP